MARMVRLDAAGPVKIDAATWPRDEHGNPKTLWVCACGLSAKFPFCDGTHKCCREEQPDSIYRYDPATKAVVSCEPEKPADKA